MKLCPRYPIPKSLPSGKGLALLFLPFELLFVLVSTVRTFMWISSTLSWEKRGRYPPRTGYLPHFYRETVDGLSYNCAESGALVVVGAVDVVSHDADITILYEEVVGLRGVPRVIFEVSHHHV